jgi:hypothetical protein
MGIFTPDSLSLPPLPKVSCDHQFCGLALSFHVHNHHSTPNKQVRQQCDKHVMHIVISLSTALLNHHHLHYRQHQTNGHLAVPARVGKEEGGREEGEKRGGMDEDNVVSPLHCLHLLTMSTSRAMATTVNDDDEIVVAPTVTVLIVHPHPC